MRIMKALAILIGFFVVDAGVFGQCNEFYQLKEGSEWTMESYDAKGRPAGKTMQQVTSFSENGNSFVARVHSVVVDKKDKEVMNGDLDFTCEDGTMIVDMRNFVNEEQMKAFSNYEMQIESENLEIPGALKVGQTLKDGSINITTTNSPIPMTMSVTITNRKVVGKESVTTPAGTFDCFKITSTSTVKSKMGIGMTLAIDNVEWLAPKVATVKSESYRNGKLQGYTLLTSRK